MRLPRRSHREVIRSSSEHSEVEWGFTAKEQSEELVGGKLLRTAVPNLFGTRDWFHGRQFFHGRGGKGGGFGMIQVPYIYCALYFCYYYISSTSDHQALDPGGWGPLIKRK